MNDTDVAEWCISVRHAGQIVCEIMRARKVTGKAESRVAAVMGSNARVFNDLAFRSAWRWSGARGNL